VTTESIIGIDPGASGGVGVYTGGRWRAFRAPPDVLAYADTLRGAGVLPAPVVYIEAVHAMRNDSRHNAFAFGFNTGAWHGAIGALGWSVRTVAPVTWQSKLGCRTKGDKSVTRTMALRLWPDLKVTHATADALLITLYGAACEGLVDFPWLMDPRWPYLPEPIPVPAPPPSDSHPPLYS